MTAGPVEPGNTGRPWRSWRALVPVLVLALGLLAVVTGGAAAQGFDLRQFFGQKSEQEPPSSQPQRSLPEAGFDPARVPTAQDYARLADQRRAEPTLGDVGEAVSIFLGRLERLAERTPDAFTEIGTTLAAASPNGRSSYFVGVAIFAALLLVIGQGARDLYASFIARPIFVSMQRPDPQGYADKLPVLAVRILLTLAGAAIMLVVAAGVGLILYDAHKATLLTVIVIFGAYVGIMMIDTIWRMTLAPFLPEYRLPVIGDRPARRLYRLLASASTFGVASAAFCYWVEALGLPREIHVIVTVVLTLATVSLFLGIIRGNRNTIARIILSGRSRAEASWLAAAAATLWAPLASVYLLFTWADMSFRLVMGIEAGPSRLIVPYLVLIGGLTVYSTIIFAIERGFRRRTAPMLSTAAEEAAVERAAEADEVAAAVRARAEAMTDEPEGDEASLREGRGEADATRFATADEIDDDGDEEAGGAPVAAPEPAAMPPYRGMRSIEDLARQAAGLFATGMAVYALILFWGGADVFERYVVLAVLDDVIEIAFIGYLAFQAVRIRIDQKIAEETADEPDEAQLEGEGGGAGASRLATLLPLVRNAILILIATAILLVIAMKLGANVAPLFAGAGIIGLAIGFGSQALVRDILSGAFFLFDDAFRRGEYIDVGGVKGTVEKISLRSFQLRHHLGMLHTIPFGEIKHLTNFSRDWVMMKLPLRLTYDTDVERVRKLVKKLGQQLLEDPEVGEKFLAPLKSQGVIQMEESAMIVRVKFMTRPGDQWVVRKRVYHEIRELFAREGIHFAHREVTVRIPDMPRDRSLTADEEQAVGAAARSALDVVGPGDLPRTGTGGSDDR